MDGRKKYNNNQHGFRIPAMQVNDESASWGAAGDSVLMTLAGLDILNLRFVHKLLTVNDMSRSLICYAYFYLALDASYAARNILFL